MLLTAPFVHSKIKNLTNVYIFGLGVLAILFTYFVGGNTFIPNDPSLYQPQIISELNIGDISQVKYQEPKRFFYETIRTGYAQFAFSILAVFLLQYFLFLNMGHKGSYKRFAPYMYIVIFAVLLWSALFIFCWIFALQNYSGICCWSATYSFSLAIHENL